MATSVPVVQVSVLAVDRVRKLLLTEVTELFAAVEGTPGVEDSELPVTGLLGVLEGADFDG